MKIYFATSNKSKVANAQAALRPFGITVEQIVIDLVESRSEDPADIALEKARQAYKKLHHPVIVEDSGFFIRALGDFPKTHIKLSLNTLGVVNIIKMLRGVKDRHAEWHMTLAYVSGSRQFKTFTYVERGELTKDLRPIKRPMMSDYWRVYVPKMIPGNRKALCEMTDASLRETQGYFAQHNQFMMFGRWFVGQKRS
jgi:XTP/dITP diphosphohydrolase